MHDVPLLHYWTRQLQVQSRTGCSQNCRSATTTAHACNRFKLIHSAGRPLPNLCSVASPSCHFRQALSPLPFKCRCKQHLQAELPWAQNAHQRRPALAGRLGRLRLPWGCSCDVSTIFCLARPSSALPHFYRDTFLLVQFLACFCTVRHKEQSRANAIPCDVTAEIECPLTHSLFPLHWSSTVREGRHVSIPVLPSQDSRGKSHSVLLSGHWAHCGLCMISPLPTSIASLQPSKTDR